MLQAAGRSSVSKPHRNRSGQRLLVFFDCPTPRVGARSRGGAPGEGARIVDLDIRCVSNLDRA